VTVAADNAATPLRTRDLNTLAAITRKKVLGRRMGRHDEGVRADYARRSRRACRGSSAI
jgi:hypothetical protein